MERSSRFTAAGSEANCFVNTLVTLANAPFLLQFNIHEIFSNYDGKVRKFD
jgi:hypothetical protein